VVVELNPGEFAQDPLLAVGGNDKSFGNLRVFPPDDMEYPEVKVKPFIRTIYEAIEKLRKERAKDNRIKIIIDSISWNISHTHVPQYSIQSHLAYLKSFYPKDKEFLTHHL